MEHLQMVTNKLLSTKQSSSNSVPLMYIQNIIYISIYTMSIRLIENKVLISYINGQTNGNVKILDIKGDDYLLTYPGIVIDASENILEYTSSKHGISMEKSKEIIQNYKYDKDWMKILFNIIEPDLNYILTNIIFDEWVEDIKNNTKDNEMPFFIISTTENHNCDLFVSFTT